MGLLAPSIERDLDLRGVPEGIPAPDRVVVHPAAPPPASPPSEPALSRGKETAVPQPAKPSKPTPVASSEEEITQGIDL
jgi:hypothetical protein